MIYQMLKNCVNGNIRNIKMLEIGCGNGRVLQYLSKKGVNIEGADISIDALKFCKGQVNTLLYQTDALKIPFPKESYDVIGMFDLMEHIEDDRSLLNEVFRICKKNGKVIISVPANKFLWSYFDVLSGHKRRYTKNELIFKLERAGFKINRISFFMFFLFPIYLIFRRISIFRICNKKQDIKKLTEVKTIPLINKIFLIIFRIENLLLTQFNLPYGTSLILVAEKIN